MFPLCSACPERVKGPVHVKVELSGCASQWLCCSPSEFILCITDVRAHSCHGLDQCLPFLSLVHLSGRFVELPFSLSPLCFPCPLAEHDSDSDSELSLDEHSSSYASSHSSDSEEDGLETENKWNTSTSKNNEHGPLHSTPKGTPSARGGQWCSKIALD